MVSYPHLYDSLAEFIAGMDPQKVLSFHAPQDIQRRVEQILEKKQNEGISEQEENELEHYIRTYCKIGEIACSVNHFSRVVMSRNIPEALRQAVAKRAAFRCEYCRRPEEDSFIKYQVDHIISIKHGGRTIPENLAFSCPICNY